MKDATFARLWQVCFTSEVMKEEGEEDKLALEVDVTENVVQLTEFKV